MAVVLPFLLILVFNAINFGYFFIVAVNITAAPRSAAEYSILGATTPAGDVPGLPAATPAGATDATVAGLVYQDLQGALSTFATNASVQVCSKQVLVGTPPKGVNGTGATLVANCVTCSSRSSCGTGGVATGPLAPSPDPRAPNFVLHRVDITYTFNTMIPGAPFNLALIPTSLCNSSGLCTFHRQVSMRAMD